MKWFPCCGFPFLTLRRHPDFRRQNRLRRKLRATCDGRLSDIYSDSEWSLCGCGDGSKLNHQGTAGCSPCFHLPGFHLGYLCLTYTHLGLRVGDIETPRVAPGSQEAELLPGATLWSLESTDKARLEPSRLQRGPGFP